MPRPYLTVIGVLLVAGSLVVLVGAVLLPLWRANAARSWPQTTCTIESKEVVETELRIDWRIVLVNDGEDVHAVDAPVRMAR